MNQSTRRKTRHLLHFLLAWVLIGAQITLPLGALLAAVQPTPPMAQAIAQRAGLGDWLAQRAGDLTAWAQPLWGTPKSAQAATAYGNPVALLSTTHGATITTGRTGLCTILNCFITNSGNVVDSNTTNLGNISIPLGLVGGVYFSVDTTATFPAGTRAGFLIDNGGGLIDLSLFSSFSLTTYLSGVQQESVSSAALLDVSLFGGANSNAISFVTTKNFDEVRLTAGSLIGALLDLDVFYAFVQYPTAGTALWGIKNYTNFGYLNTAVSPWTWVTVATLSGGNYNAAAAITRSQGIIFNQTTRVFHLVNPTTGALTALTLTNAGSIPRTLNYNVATYDPATNRYFAALENDQYGHIFTVNTATNQITYVSEINAGTSINSDDWVFVNGKVVGLDHGTLETWDVTNNTYAETSAPGADLEQEVAGMWVNADGTIGFVSHTTDVGQYTIGTNTKSLVAQTNASFPCCGEPNDLAGSIFGLTSNLPGGLLNQPYSGSVTAGGGAPPYSNYTATGLPAGLSIIAATGAVTGTPTAGGTFPVTFGVTDSENYTATATFNIFIREGAPGGVVTDLAFWYNPESGVTLNSGKVSSWVDQANGIAVTPAVASNGPTYYDSGANLINFNPTLNFTNATRQDGLRATSGLPAIPNGVSTFSVLLPDDASSRWFLQWGVSGAGYYVNYGTGCGANNPGVWTNSHGGCVNTPTTLGPITTPSFLSSRWNSTAGTNQWQLRRNGQLHSGATTSTALNVPADTALEIGDVNQRTAGNEYVGNISEVIGYTARVSDVDRQKIESYLAIKYGITYMNDANTAARGYLDSAGATVWDATANSSYSSNIAGIGRDDASVLQQKQSKSVNSGFQPAIGLGAVAASNAANNNSFSANKSFLLWGDNGQAASYGASYTPGSFTPAAGYFRMNRVWKVQETGTITNVVVQATDTDHLLVSSDPTFATGVTEIDMSSGSATVNFSNGQYFTFGRELVAPGGVSAGLGVWLRADQGSSTTTDGQAVADWADFGPGGNDVTQPTAANQPKFKEVNLNFNPALEFDGSNDVLYKSDGSTIIPNQTDPVSMLTVSTQRAGSGWWQTLLSFSGAADYPALHWLDGRQALYIDGVQDFRHSVVIPYNTPTMFVSRANNATPRDLRMANNGLSNQDTSTVGSGTFPAAGGSKLFTVGSEVTTGSETLNGFLNEGLVYNRFLSDAEVNRIHTYFAIKYSVMFDNGATNYVATDGTTVIWDATANSGYKNNITGIGRDDAEALKQKQSKSINSGFQPTIGLGAIAASNAANSNSFSANKSYLIWGDNGQAASYGASYTPSSFTPTGGYYRMNRVWKVQETGTITDVVVMADGAEHLLVSSDPTFATGVTEVAFSSGSATVNFANGQYFTFGATANAPGGVAGNLTAWYKANAGAENNGNAATDGVSVDAWRDQSLNSNDAAQSTGTLKPEWLADNGKFNFNPSVTFVPDARLQAQLSAGGWNNNDGTVYVIYNQETTKTGWRNLVDFGLTASDSNNPQLGMSDNNRIATWMDGFDRDNTNWTPVINETRLIGYDWQFNVGGHSYYFDGETFTGSATHKIGATGINIGNYANIGGDPQLSEYFPGQIAEIVLFAEQHDASERARVQSYLALKYGITLDANPGSSATNFDYLHSGSTVIWAGNSTNSGYHNDVTGIGRDDASALDQRKSKSVNGDDPIIIDNGAAFSANRAFLVWGNNNSAVSLTAAYNGGSNNRLARVWKVQETGAVSTVKVILPRSAVAGAGLRSLIVHSSDANFGTVDRTYPLVVSGGNYETTVNFNNGDFFTFSSSFTIPEINVTPGTLDFGEINVGVVSPAQAVTIQNQGEVSLSISNISLSGTDAARFAISSNNCGASLSAGASCTVQITFSPTTSGSRSALLVITNNDSDESTVNVALSGTTPGSSGGGGTPGTYNLAVSKSASVSTATIGVPFTYTITVYNKGTIAAANVTMTDQLPAGVTFGAANATGGGTCNHNSGTVTCTWAALAGGASATVTISVTP